VAFRRPDLAALGLDDAPATITDEASRLDGCLRQLLTLQRLHGIAIQSDDAHEGGA
jgi:hypothetical protein